MNNEHELSECLATLLQEVSDHRIASNLMTPEFHIRCIDALAKSKHRSADYLDKLRIKQNPMT